MIITLMLVTSLSTHKISFFEILLDIYLQYLQYSISVYFNGDSNYGYCVFDDNFDENQEEDDNAGASIHLQVHLALAVWLLV